MSDDTEVVESTESTALALDSAQDITEERDVPCAFVCGIAGSGKTTLVRERVQSQDGYGILCASTGIAAVNLNATTVNSLLGYFDSASMRDAFLSGFISRKLHDLALEYEWLIWDEISMADGDQLDIAYRAMQEANRYRDITRPMGIMCVGDFCQLPPIKAKWAFEANCWDKFAANTTKLTEVHRQGDVKFLAALNLVRAGNGAAGAESLTQAGVQWESQLDTEFDGTTILPKSDQVDRFNQIALDRLQAKQIVVQSRRWGKLRKEWAHVPERLSLKLGCYVMILSNAPDFSYVNGDCGHLIEYTPASRTKTGELVPDCFLVKLVRTGRTESIYRVVRDVAQKDRPEGWSGQAVSKLNDTGEYLAYPHYRGQKKRYVQGQLESFPLRVAYASTVHKSQGLSLDKVQIDFRNHFFGMPAMAYVSVSRARTIAGLRLVGQREVFAKRVQIDPKVKEWL